MTCPTIPAFNRVIKLVEPWKDKVYNVLVIREDHVCEACSYLQFVMVLLSEDDKMLYEPTPENHRSYAMGEFSMDVHCDDELDKDFIECLGLILLEVEDMFTKEG